MNFQPFTPAADGWIHLASLGEHPVTLTREGKPERVVQLVDSAACERMAANHRAAGAPELLLDFDHDSLAPDRSSEAAGWIGELATKPDGLWGRVRWSKAGMDAVVNGEYRFVSPVWDLVPVAGNTARLTPSRLINAAVTNAPNLRGLHAISNRKNCRTAANEQPTIPKKMDLKQIAAALGLPDTADEAAVLAAIKALKDQCSAAETEVAENRTREAAVELDRAGITDTKARETLAALVAKNRETGLTALRALPDKTPAVPAVKPALTAQNRAQTPTALPQQDKATALEQLTQQIRVANRCSYQDAFEEASRQRPDLLS